MRRLPGWLLPVTVPGFLACTDDCLKIVPDRKRMAAFDREGRYSAAINRSSYFFALPPGSGQPVSYENPGNGPVLWKVNPLDARLEEIGVDRIAFADEPLSAELNRRLAPLSETTLPGLQVYHLR